MRIWERTRKHLECCFKKHAGRKFKKLGRNYGSTNAFGECSEITMDRLFEVG